MKSKIERNLEDSLCKLCKKADDSVEHVFSGCSKLGQKELKGKHDTVGKVVHWKLVEKCTFEVTDKWYEHKPERTLENENLKVIWDFNIQTDHVIEAWRSDLVLVDKKNRKIIGF